MIVLPMFFGFVIEAFNTALPSVAAEYAQTRARQRKELVATDEASSASASERTSPASIVAPRQKPWFFNVDDDARSCVSEPLLPIVEGQVREGAAAAVGAGRDGDAAFHSDSLSTVMADGVVTLRSRRRAADVHLVTFGDHSRLQALEQENASLRLQVLQLQRAAHGRR
jgi:hypothetical protein